MNHQPPYLEKYKGIASRHECPACHDKRSFAYYIDVDTGQVIDKSVGRCNHESGCGYHYSPSQFLKDNPQRKENRTPIILNRTPRSEPLKEPGRIPEEYLDQSSGYKSNFIAFLCSIFDRYTEESPTIERLMNDYYLGCAKDGSVIYWQVNTDSRVRTGKVMQYNPETGKRIKNASGAIDWVHAKLKRDNVLSDDFNLVQCLFGEHLLPKYPDKVVALVEAEKSALIAAGVYPEYVWLATGGKSRLSPDKLQILKGRTVVMFPDVDGYELWTEKARELQQHGYKVMVSDVLEANASLEDRENKIDLADWLIWELRQAAPATETMPPLTHEEQTLHHLGNFNPAVYKFIDTLGLVSATTGESLRVIN